MRRYSCFDDEVSCSFGCVAFALNPLYRLLSLLYITWMNPSPPTAHRRSCNLSRDQRLEVLKLHEAGHGPIYISKELGITRRQVKYTIYRGHVSPQKSKGRPPKLTSEQVDELEAFFVASRVNRRMSYLELAMQFSKWNVGEGAIKGALARRGYVRYRARNLLDNTEGDNSKTLQMEKTQNEAKSDTDQLGPPLHTDCSKLEYNTETFQEIKRHII